MTLNGGATDRRFEGFERVPIGLPPGDGREQVRGKAGEGMGGKADDHAEDAKPLAVWTLDDMLDLEPPTWVIEGHLPLGGRVLDFAPSGHHKTNLAVDQACHVAHGLDWHGHAVTAHPVIVVATEDPHGAAMRVVGWHDRYDMPSGRVLVVPGGELRLNDPAMIARLKATAARHFPGERVGYVVDHYDVSVEGDPTSTEEAKGAAEGLRELGRDAAFVLLLAHCPWTTDGRAKVPVTLWANVDARRKIERDEATGQATLTLQHQKNGRSGLVLKFEFEQHEFTTRRGVASCLIARKLPEDACAAPKPEGPKMGDNERIVLDSLAAALADRGREPPPSHDITQGVRCARYDEWLEAAERYLPSEKEGFRRKEAIKRAATSLIRKKVVCHVDGWCWVRRAEAHRTASHASHGIACEVRDARP